MLSVSGIPSSVAIWMQIQRRQFSQPGAAPQLGHVEISLPMLRSIALANCCLPN